MSAIFFKNAKEFREWLMVHHSLESELEVGFYKKNSGLQNMTWSEAVDEALCFGWIDGVRHSIDKLSYKIRFTPRKEKSNWSEINLKKVQTLMGEGRMHQAGLDVYNRWACKNGY